MRRLRGTSIIEYAVLIFIIVAALVAMKVYLERALCGKWRQAADVFGYGRQWSSKQPQ